MKRLRALRRSTMMNTYLTLLKADSGRERRIEILEELLRQSNAAQVILIAQFFLLVYKAIDIFVRFIS